jgi:hypothetical protein
MSMKKIAHTWRVPAVRGGLVWIGGETYRIVGPARDGSQRLRVRPLAGGRATKVHPVLDLDWNGPTSARSQARELHFAA